MSDALVYVWIGFFAGLASGLMIGSSVMLHVISSKEEALHQVLDAEREERKMLESALRVARAELDRWRPLRGEHGRFLKPQINESE